MVKPANKYKEILKNLETKGKVAVLNTQKDIDAFEKISKNMEEYQRQYQVKERNSQIAASQVTLTA